ncbi:Uncharacterised protein [Mammaliicoccus lentus]|nr:Uncharacterised protein [Mammaliicoccus lentus]
MNKWLKIIELTVTILNEIVSWIQEDDKKEREV